MHLRLVLDAAKDKDKDDFQGQVHAKVKRVIFCFKVNCIQTISQMACLVPSKNGAFIHCKSLHNILRLFKDFSNAKICQIF